VADIPNTNRLIVEQAIKHGASGVKEVGARGIIAPATRPQRLAELRSLANELMILTPGVGAQGGSAADAILAGADYIIVGRSIYQADDPRAAAQKLADEIKKAF